MIFIFYRNKNLYCGEFKNTREIEICHSIERFQEFGLHGHGTFFIGYYASFSTAQKAWCDLNINEKDLEILNTMQYNNSSPYSLSVGAGLLYNLLNVKINPKPEDLYSVYSPTSDEYLLKDSCKK